MEDMTMKVLVTGGMGFIGSHVAEFYAKKGAEVVCVDNLSRAELLKRQSVVNPLYNHDYLERNYPSIKLIKQDVRDLGALLPIMQDVDLIVHTAAQTAVTTSVTEPEQDFTVNAQGTFNVLEAARRSGSDPTIVYCSTNKVYGDNVNTVPVSEEETRYRFADRAGITEMFSIDRCEHTPYGCSKLTGDLYVQDYGHLYGLRTGVFRMSCIYGTRQLGVADQGWVMWFTLATLGRQPLTIFGDGKQVRDVLYVTDLVEAYDAFYRSDLRQGVFNTGGGPDNTLSLLELLDILDELTGIRSELSFADWRPSDQKVYISDLSRIRDTLGWTPKVGPQEGMERIVEWARTLSMGE